MEIGFPKKMAQLTEWSLMQIRISLTDQKYRQQYSTVQINSTLFLFLTSLRACTAG